MKFFAVLFLFTILIVAGCETSRPSATDGTLSARNDSAIDSPKAIESKTLGQEPSILQKVSLSDADRSALISQSLERKILRDANLTIEVNSTTETQHQITSIAEQHGGFVVMSEAKQRENIDPAKRLLEIKLVLRVPENQFGPALNEIKGLGGNLTQESVTGQDVTEEFIDLEARLKTQKALEMQFLEIMKQAGKIADALEVQRQVAEVRTEIEKLEGRKRFLQNRATLSTITVNILSPTPIVVSATGFTHSIREAISESIDVASGISLFLIRFVIVMVPVFLMLILPLLIVALYFKRRFKRIRLAQTLNVAPASE